MSKEKITIALAGNPNSGKTTLFNALTGANQYVGNWPGVTVEKKEGKLKKHEHVTITDLPGIYSLSPYTLEEVVARNYLINEKPDAILNIVDGTNLERNLYLTTQLLELGIPVVVAVNMMDVVRKNNDKINIDHLSKTLNAPIVEISALKQEGVMAAAEKAISLVGQTSKSPLKYSDSIEQFLTSVEESVLSDKKDSEKRWYAVKLFERDSKVLETLKLDSATYNQIDESIKVIENKMDDDSESIITNERYEYISRILKDCYKKGQQGKLTTSDKIDQIVTNRWLGLPIFAIVMWIVYYVSISTVGGMCTDFVNDGLFGDGWFLFGNGRDAYDEASAEYTVASDEASGYESALVEAGLATETEDGVEITDESALDTFTASVDLYDDEGNVSETVVVDKALYEEVSKAEEPDPSSYGTWVPGIPVLVEDGLNAVHAADWLQDLVLNGIVAGVGAVLGFVPQILVLFFFLAFLEGCGYMARIAFVMDRIFRKFGLSGKSFIPMLIGTGCGIPGIMASRTIENERDRRMTIMTTTFIPCSAKLPIIALISGALFNNSGTIGFSAYFVGIAAIVCSGIILKKTKMFAGDPAPFVMELPSYHLPTISYILNSMWERGYSFIKKAGSVILLATIFVWFTSSYGFVDGSFGAVSSEDSLLAVVGNAIAWIFTPLGFGDWRAAVACITGLIAKENVVGTLGILYGGFDEVAENGWQIWVNMRTMFTPISGYSFLLFNLLCAPCFAAIGAIKREMNNAKWTWFAIGYQCVFAYMVALTVNQIGNLVTTGTFGVFTVVAFALIVLFVYLLFRPYHESQVLTTKISNN